MRKTRRGLRSSVPSVLATLSLWLSVTPATLGQGVVPSGSELQVNSYATGNQGSSSVAVAPGGGFFVVWDSQGSPQGDAEAIEGRFFDAAGVAVGDDFQVNVETAGQQSRSAVAARPTGDFVVVWESGANILGRRIDASGAPVGGELPMSSSGVGFQRNPAIAAGPTGELVVVWAGSSSAGTDSSGYSIQGRRFDSNGSPLGDDFQVNTYTTGFQRDPEVAIGPGGEFTVVWHSYESGGSDSDGASIQGRRYDADGNPLGDDFQVNSETAYDQFSPGVVFDAAGSFLVVWSSSYDIEGQRYDATGTTVGGEFQVNSAAGGRQFRPRAAADRLGNFLVVWWTNDSDLSDFNGVEGRSLAPDGTPIGNDFEINTYTTGFQRDPAVAVDPGGRFVVTWYSDGSNGSDEDGTSIQAQRYLGSLLFSDGFELGNTSAWTATTP